MSFLSFNFAIFLAVALLIFHLGRPSWRPGLLLGLSYAFYLTFGLGHTLLLAAVTTLVYAAALLIEKNRGERGKFALAVLGAAVLLVFLFAFKAAGWMADTFAANPVIGGLSATMLVAPLGLSYYTFKMLGYLLSVYWEELPAQHNFVSFALYTSFFPQILSGPIQRAEDFFDQIDKLKSPSTTDFVTGLRRILFGLLKKIVIADRLSLIADTVHANPSGFSHLELLFGAYCYSLQLYSDFSGITDIAIGVGLLFGVKGPENFDLPYFSPNIQVFWRRWHMSLTSWLTDYLFTPLRMSFRALGTTGLCLAIFINMVAVGLWHGLTMTYLVFGILNGIFLVISVLTMKSRNTFFKDRPGMARLRTVAAPLITFHLVVFAQIFFRAESMHSALVYVTGLLPGLRHLEVPAWRFDLHSLDTKSNVLANCAVALIAMESIHWAMRQQSWIGRFKSAPRLVRWSLYYAAVVILLFLFRATTSFVYAQF